GSLRKAILDANAHPNPANGIDSIAFNITGTGVRTIQPPSGLPAITDPVLIDGTTQPGFAGTPLILLDGLNAGATANALTFNTGGSNALFHSGVSALAIGRFAVDGIFLNMTGGNRITGCYVGTDATGTTALANGADGIGVRSQNNTIGGTAG